MIVTWHRCKHKTCILIREHLEMLENQTTIDITYTNTEMIHILRNIMKNTHTPEINIFEFILQR